VGVSEKIWHELVDFTTSPPKRIRVAMLTVDEKCKINDSIRKKYGNGLMFACGEMSDPPTTPPSTECLGGSCNQGEVMCLSCFYDYVKKNEPELANTFDWEEHPENYEDCCYCALCRSYMN